MPAITGTADNDTLQGTADPDTINGLGGDDELFGNDGNDTLLGGLGNDLLDGGVGDDLLDGGDGADQLSGWAGNDTMFAYGGDSANGGEGNDTLTIGDGLGSVYDGGGGTDTLALDLTLAASGIAADLTFLWAGLNGSIGTATVSSFEAIGGAITGSGFDDSVTIGVGYASAVTMNLGAGNDSGTGGSGGDTLSGGDGGDSLQGLEGNDTLSGGLGNDTMTGGNGNDTLSDVDGIGTLNGDGGDDTVLLGVMTGGSADGGAGGTDYLNFDLAAAAAGVTVSLNFVGSSMSGSVGGVSISGFEAMALLFNQTTEFADTITLGAAFDRAMTVNLLGGNDNYTGGLGGDYVNGGTGNDALGGGGGTNTLIGGIGNDSYTVENNTTTLVESAGQGTDTVLASLNWGLADEFENLTLTGFGNIDGYGNGAANVITGNNGNNRVEASAGNDTIHGGNGNDTLYGMEGNDTINGDGGNDNIEDGVGTNTINGGAGDDYIVFNGDAVNFADGGIGTDSLDIRTFGRTTGFVIDLTGLWTGGSGSVNGGTVTGFESLIGFEGTQWADVINFGAGTTATAGINDAGAGNDTLTGTDGANYINGGDGNDTIVSGAGTDELLGAAGNDSFTLSVSTAGTVDGGTGTDTLGFVPAEAGAFDIDFTLLWSGGVGTVNGVAVTGIELLETNLIQSDHFVTSGDDSVVIGAGYIGNLNMQLGRGADSASGGSGNDTINGEQDDDVIHGGAGNDTLGGSYASDYVYGDAGDDTIYGDTLDVEWASGNDHLYGGDGNDTIEGGAFDDSLYGNDGNDVLLGDSLALDPADHGNDWLEGGAGNDVVDGSAGNDTASYAGAASGVTVTLATAAAQNTGGAGIDQLLAIENLVGSAFNDVLTGSGSVNTIEGGAGNDTMTGGFGTDTASFASASAFVVVSLAIVTAQNTRAGTDTLSGFERLIGSAFNDQLTGDGGANTLYGRAGNDYLRGGAGNDIFHGEDGDDRLDGGAGDDTLNGNTGRDTAVYSSATSAVSISMAVVGAQSTGGAGVDTLTSIERLIGSAFGDSLSGNTSNNVIYGEGGNDTISASSGSDVIYGGLGNDTLTGGLGRDTFVFDTALNGATNVDTLTDFTAAYDKVQLSTATFAGLIGTGTLSFNAFYAGTTAHDATDRIIYDSVTGRIYYDADGDGGGAQILFAQVAANTAVTNSDFNLIG